MSITALFEVEQIMSVLIRKIDTMPGTQWGAAEFVPKASVLEVLQDQLRAVQLMAPKLAAPAEQCGDGRLSAPLYRELLALRLERDAARVRFDRPAFRAQAATVAERDVWQRAIAIVEGEPECLPGVLADSELICRADVLAALRAEQGAKILCIYPPCADGES